jgi:hypothetical protein
VLGVTKAASSIILILTEARRSHNRLSVVSAAEGRLLARDPDGSSRLHGNASGDRVSRPPCKSQFRQGLREKVADWFVRDDDVPFMLQVIAIRPERRGQIPAVTHVDGTGGLQTVDQAGNSRYHALIGAFFRPTGVPMVLNTSFNENEPVVCRPEEALDCFLRTKMIC